MIKRSLVASSADGKGGLAVLDITCRGKSVELKCDADAVCVYADGKTKCGKFNKKSFAFTGDISLGFAIAVKIGREKFFFCENLPKSAKGIKQILLEKLDGLGEGEVNIPYDDYAIATENYYAVSPEIYPTCPHETCDKGHLFSLGEQTACQNSTIYPHSVKKVEGDEIYDEIGICEQAEGACGKESEGKEKTEGDESVEPYKDGTGNESRIADGFFDTAYGELLALLAEYPPEHSLENAVSFSRFACVPYAEEKFYAVGLTEIDGEAEYVIFGVPAKEKTPPKELEGKSWFVPVTKEGYVGYHLIYQDARTGKLLSP